MRCPGLCIGMVDANRSQPVGRTVGGMQSGVDQARSNRVHPDSLGRNFTRQPNREAINRALGRSVVHPLSGRAYLGCAGGNIHDRAAGSTVAS